VAEELLDGADVVTVLQKVGGEGMAEGVAAGTLVDPVERTAWVTARCTFVSRSGRPNGGSHAIQKFRRIAHAAEVSSAGPETQKVHSL
jgi:hypothetical protein